MRKHFMTAALFVALATVASTSLAAPPTLAPLPTAPSAAVGKAVVIPPRRTHAFLLMDVGQPRPFVGQAVPVTVTAFFRDVEAVTLEGAVKLDTKAIVTSALSEKPSQSTEVVDGQPTLVVRWTGTLTPSSAGPMELSTLLPVRIRWREAAPQIVVHDVPTAPEDDPFADMDNDPFGSTFMRKMQERMLRMQRSSEQPVGRAHEEAFALKASVKPLDVRPVPLDGQPATFSGAVGSFSLKGTVSSAQLDVLTPLTLRVAVEGKGDLDRVDLPGLATTENWKAYPPKATREPATKSQPERKVFEQVLVPLRGGELRVPPVSLTMFDPGAERYVTAETQPLAVTVLGTAPAEASAPAPTAAALAKQPDEPHDEATHRALSFLTLPRALLLAGIALLLAMGLLTHRILAVRREERRLRKEMKRAASRGSASEFLDAAHGLIETRLSRRWGLPPDEITSARIEERLGANGDSLADILRARDAVRFARGGLDTVDLSSRCAAVEVSLRHA